MREVAKHTSAVIRNRTRRFFISSRGARKLLHALAIGSHHDQPILIEVGERVIVDVGVEVHPVGKAGGVGGEPAA